MHPPDFLPSNPQSLSDQLRRRTEQLRSKIIKTNYNTQFVRTAPELSDFRDATAGRVDDMDDDSLSETFRKTVRFTTYDSYASLIARFSERPCKASAVVDMLAPGLPDCLFHSSSTSGGLKKVFPKYNILSQLRSPNAASYTIQDPLRRRTTAFIWYLGCVRMTVLDEDDCPAATVYQTSGSAMKQRADFHLDPEEDGERMGTFRMTQITHFRDCAMLTCHPPVLDHAAPYAAGFIRKWVSFLLIHALFALGSRSLETVIMVFINTFVDMMHHIDMNFDMVVDCIANGTIPDVEGIAEVRRYLEVSARHRNTY